MATIGFPCPPELLDGGVVAQGNPSNNSGGQGEPIALSVGPYGSGMVDPQQGLPQCCGILTA